MYIEVPDTVMRHMHKIAQREDEDLAELIGILIERYDTEGPKWATLADLHRFAAEARKRMKRLPDAEIVDATTSSREFLNTELTDYPLERTDP